LIEAFIGDLENDNADGDANGDIKTGITDIMLITKIAIINIAEVIFFLDIQDYYLIFYMI